MSRRKRIKRRATPEVMARRARYAARSRRNMSPRSHPKKYRGFNILETLFMLVLFYIPEELLNRCRYTLWRLSNGRIRP